MKLPTGWTKQALVEVFPDITVGFVGNVSSHYCDENTGVPFYRTGNVRDGIFSHHDRRFVTSDFHRKNRKSTISNGDILIARVGANLGMVCKVDGISGDANAANVIIVRKCPEANSDYFAEYLSSPLGQSQIYAGSVGGAQGVFNTGLAERIVVLVPPIEEQTAIASFLSCWNRAVAKTEELIATKDRHFAATSHLLLAAKRRMKRFSPRWDLRRADHIFENTSRKGHLDEPLLSVTQEHGVIPRGMLEGRVTMPSGDTGAFKLVEPGNFVISLRSFQGGLEHSEYRGLVSPAYTVLREKLQIDERFFRHYFKSADFIKRLSVAVIGIRDGKQISFQDFCSIKLPFPPVEEQKAIAAVLDESERGIGLLRQYAQALRTQKRGLMQKLLTGQWRLPARCEETA